MLVVHASCFNDGIVREFNLRLELEQRVIGPIVSIENIQPGEEDRSLEHFSIGTGMTKDREQRIKEYEKKKKDSAQVEAEFREARKQYEKDLRAYNKQIEKLAEMEAEVGSFPGNDMNVSLDEKKYLMPRVGEFNLTAA